MFVCKRVHIQHVANAPKPPGFEIERTACPHLYRLLGFFQCAHGFIQHDRGVEVLLNVSIDVQRRARRQRLFNRQQLIFIQ
ncbi:hypothetical protein SE16_08660 [Ardenticatena maritima]|uniref:Uncharacterized protein n=1 Tax=Ardenticatena maritima TaxID=872965 RepID=A0A0P6XTB2_9CHLR|nr:hypothetical protein SE16_08660 [Ardenticatena maritima]